MHEEDPKVANVEPPPRLECTGIWGGIRNRDIEITAGKVIGSIYSAACEACELWIVEPSWARLTN